MPPEKVNMNCNRCGKEIPAEKAHTHKGKSMCEDYFMYIGLFPLEHTGQHKKLFYIKDTKRHR